MPSKQLSLFQGVQQAYTSGPLTNTALYSHLSQNGSVCHDELETSTPVGLLGKMKRGTIAPSGAFANIEAAWRD